jgi:hypothetical protein
MDATSATFGKHGVEYVGSPHEGSRLASERHLRRHSKVVDDRVAGCGRETALDGWLLQGPDGERRTNPWRVTTPLAQPRPLGKPESALSATDPAARVPMGPNMGWCCLFKFNSIQASRVSASLRWLVTLLPLLFAASGNVAAAEESFSFVVWGHPRSVVDGQPPLHVEEVIDRVSELKADFLVITGDMISGRPERDDPTLLRNDWEVFDDSLRQLDIPIYRVPGNHDANDPESRDIYLERYPEPPYAFTFRGSRFVLLDSLSLDRRTVWNYAALPFSDEQLGFIRGEIEQQGSYDHLFFFMHHTSPWSNPSGFWWDDVHPLLRSGRTRAVFTGDNPHDMKYAHDEHDGIHYFLNNTYPTPAAEHFSTYPQARRGWRKQLDNLMYVRVDGDTITYRPFIVGALTNRGSSWIYWREVDAERAQVQRNAADPDQGSFGLRDLTLGSIAFAAGIAVASMWHLARNRI